MNHALRDAGDVAADDGQAVVHGFEADVWQAVPVTRRIDDGGHDEHVGLAVLFAHAVGREHAFEMQAVSKAEQLRLGFQFLLQRAVADEIQLKIEALFLQKTARLNQEFEAFFFHHPPDGDKGEGAVIFGLRFLRPDFDAVVKLADFLGIDAGQGIQVLFVGGGASAEVGGVGDFADEAAVVGIDIHGVGRAAVGDAGDFGEVERRVAGGGEEVGVDEVDFL